MYKKLNLKHFEFITNSLKKIMKIFILLITIGLSSAYSNTSYAQKKLDIDVNKVTIEQLFEEIQNTSEFVFFYKEKTIDPQVKVTLQMKKKTLATILNKSFYGTDLTYAIDGRQVVIKKSKSNQSDLKASVIEETPVNQEFKITGTVLDADGILLPGASIIEKGTTNGTVTDFDGQFSLIVSNKNAVLIVTYLGYSTLEQAVDGQSTIKLTLLEDTQNLDEVVVIGYGTVKKSDLTGSLSSLKGEVMEMTPITTIEQGMQGRMAGVNISSATGEPGGGMNIIIRGASSVSGGNQPLYVIDGIPFFNNSNDMAGDFENGNASTNQNPMSSLNPNDIESIEVLKDASSTGMYGSRGSNGVIMITTKQGKAGKGKINIDFKSSYTMLPETIDLVNAQQYAELMNEFNEYLGDDPIYDGTYHPAQNGEDRYFPTPEEIPDLMGEGTDWQKEIMRHATSNDLNVRMSGGSKDINYNISGGFLNTEGLLKNTSFDRYSLRGGLNFKLNEVVKLSWNVNGSIVTSNRSNTNTTRFNSGGAERSGVIVKAFMSSPVMRVGESWFNDNVENSNGSFGTFNPLVDLTDQYYFKKNYNLNTNLRLDFKITDKLTFVTRGGLRFLHDKQDRYWNLNTSQGNRANGKSLYNSAVIQNLVNENFFTYITKVENHNINLIAGMSIEKKSREAHTYGFQDYSLVFDNGLFYDSYASGQDPVMPITRKIESNLISMYGRLSYNYDGRFYFTSTFRGDASSVFSANNKWALFPSVGLGWNLDKEDFMSDIDWISKTKLRGSYGLSGNQAIAPYQSLPSLGIDNFSFVDGRTLGVLPTVPGNEDLTWETTTQIDAGIDVGFLNNKYSLTFDYYKKTTNDLLLNMPVLSQSGFTNILSNFGNLVNEGYEVEATLKPVRKRDVRWKVDLNWSTNKASISKLNNLEFIDYTTRINGGNVPTHRLGEGGRIGNFFGYETAGLLTQEDIDNGYPTLAGSDDVGEMKYVDHSGDGTISLEDAKILGNAYPDHIFGINNSVTYKHFTLSFLIRGAVGQEVLNMMRIKTHMGAGNRGVAATEYYHNRWTPENPDGIYPRNTGNYTGITDELVEDGSYIRLQNVTLNYKIPQNISWMNMAELYLTGFNLYTWHNYSGYDPEVSSYGQNLLRGGIDRGSYPRTTTFTLGVRIRL